VAGRDSRSFTLPLPPPRVPRAVREFLHTEASGGIVLLVATIVALVWANSPWREAYSSLWHTEIGIEVGTWSLREDLGHWVNDGLMALFFFVVGLEIKRELVMGELRSWKAASVPAIAAAGGMIAPALLYLAFNSGGAGSSGWGIPMATDIAFAVGVVALLGPRVPSSLKIFLLTLAVVDDIGAILVIAVFYSKGVHPEALIVAAILIGVLFFMNRALNIRSMVPYALVGVGVWLAVLESGVHATIAGVILGLLAPARPVAPRGVVAEWAAHLSDDPSAADLKVMERLASASTSVAERLEHQLHPWTSFVVIPIFALANAGLEIDPGSLASDLSSPVALGVMAGLVVGKILGITLFAWLAVRSGVGRLATGVTWPQVASIASVAGIGFTVSLFISGLAFDSAVLVDEAKLGILVASFAAAVIGSVALRATTRSRPSGT
jgi:Na+:H+ antiporter, NhaA family